MKMKSKSMITAALFTCMTAIAAFIKIPFPVVPVTLQVMVVIMAGLILNPRTAALSQIAYIIIGLTGIPVFTEGGGIHYIFSPTFGYLLGYIPGAWITAKILSAGEKKNYFFAALTGVFIIYAIGASLLFLNLNFVAKNSISILDTAKIGILPFIVPDIIKVLAAAAISKKINARQK